MARRDSKREVVRANVLRQTFIHLPQIGKVTEMELWKAGVLSWDDLSGSSRLPSRVQLRRQELLPTRYVHLVFALPHELGPLALQNKKLLCDLPLRSSAETLLQVARSPAPRRRGRLVCDPWRNCKVSGARCRQYGLPARVEPWRAKGAQPSDRLGGRSLNR